MEFNRLLVLVQEEPAFAREQPIQDPLWGKRVLALARPGAHVS